MGGGRRGVEGIEADCIVKLDPDEKTTDSGTRVDRVTWGLDRVDQRDLPLDNTYDYGAMDGAMKFVKGDAVAGVVITVINIVGGLSIGVFQKDMALVDAAQTYALLTIGDGLVSQIPALLVATAAGIAVTRVSSRGEDLGPPIAAQVVARPKALLLAAGCASASEAREGKHLPPGRPHQRQERRESQAASAEAHRDKRPLQGPRDKPPPAAPANHRCSNQAAVDGRRVDTSSVGIDCSPPLRCL